MELMAAEILLAALGSSLAALTILAWVMSRAIKRDAPKVAAALALRRESREPAAAVQVGPEVAGTTNAPSNVVAKKETTVEAPRKTQRLAAFDLGKRQTLVPNLAPAFLVEEPVVSYSLSQLDPIGDVDPVAEADVYLNYGRDLQAEEILNEAMRSNPERLDIRFKLLEVYAKRGDTKGFEQMASLLYSVTDGDGEEWLKAQKLGQQIDPDNLLYASELKPILALKLALAEEFRQIGDKDGARGVLEEVVVKASGPLKTRAQQLLDALK